MRLPTGGDGGRHREEPEFFDLLCGIGPRHIRALCEGCLAGPYNYTPEEVGRMTLDQVFFLLTDSKILRAHGRRRVVKTEPLNLISKETIKGLAADGSPISGRVVGKSVARQLMEEADKKKRRKERR